MRYLLILILLITGCGMSPREMVSDCMTEIAPIGVKNAVSYVELQGDCITKYKTCITECYLEREGCEEAHEKAIASCELYRKALIEKGDW